MNASAALASRDMIPTNDVDVLIIGAGISGIASAYYLLNHRPGTRFVILDALEDFGGTWRTHHYPGTRSDSDLFTFGYSFKPWEGNPIATRQQILDYLGEVIEANGIAEHIRYRHEIRSAAWSSDTNNWTITAENKATGEILTLTAGFVWMCSGYYDHKQGYTPSWPGFESFKGQVIHPQHWPEGLDVSGKRVTVIGSGATAATLVPALAGTAAHVTMLQRTPTYFATGRNSDQLADELRRLNVDPDWIHEIMRRKIIQDRIDLIVKSRDYPMQVGEFLINGVRDALPEGFDVDKHFRPPYRPLQQRVAFVPDADLFKAVGAGQASIVTDEIDHFTEDGIALKSGDLLKSDIVVTATGFNMTVFGNMAVTVDGKPVQAADTVTYRAMMFTGVPNLAWTFGYVHHSWTLRAELIAGFVCRVLAHMQETGARRVVPVLREQDSDMAVKSWVNPDDFSPGYVMRSAHIMPKVGDKPEWRYSHDYAYEKAALPAEDLDASPLQFSA